MPQIYEFGEFRLDVAERQLRRNGQPLQLTPKVFDTLVMLVENAGRLLPKDELMRKVWPDTFVEEVSLAQNISQLRKVLGAPAGAPQMIQTVSKRGYRFTGAVTVVTQDETAEKPSHSLERASKPREESSPPKPGKVAIWRLLGGFAALILLAIAWKYSAFSGKVNPSVNALPIRSIAVLPLVNLSADPNEEFFADGMTDDLITELARIHALRVISRTSVMQYKGTRKTLPEIARELNVDALVEGTISQRSGQIHITVQLVQANPEQHIWAESYERPLEQAQTLQSEIVREIAGALKTSMTPDEQAWMRKSRTTSAEANLLYLKGRYFWNKRTPEGIRKGEKYFKQAIEKDGDFAQAYVGLAGVYVFEGGWGMEPATVVVPRAQAAAQKAIALDSENAAAHATLGLIAMNYAWDWEKADQEYILALRLNPNDSVAHHWYAEYLGAEGRLEEALEEIDHAQQLDPLSMAVAADRGKLLYFGRHYDQAIDELRKATEMDPGFQQARYWLVRAYAEKGMDRELTAELEGLQQAEGASPKYWVMVSMVKSRIGKRDEARNAVAKAMAFSGDSDPAEMLFLQIAMGNADKSFEWLEKCYATHSTIMTSLKVNPDYDNLRSDPRFASYLRRVGLN